MAVTTPMRTRPGGDTSGSMPERRVRQRGQQCGRVEAGQGMHQPVGGETAQPGRLQRHERHHGARLPDAQGGLVAVVAVGDQQPSRRHQRGQPRHPVRIGNAPKPVARLLVIGVVELRAAGGRRVQHRFHFTLRVREQHENRIELDARGLEQTVAVLLRTAEGEFVAEHGLAVRLGVAQGDEAAARERFCAAGHGEALLVNINCIFCFGGEHALAPPSGQPGGRSRVVSAWQDEMHQVVRAARAVVLLELRRDHVIGKRGQQGDVARRRRVAKGAERMDACHDG